MTPERFQQVEKVMQEALAREPAERDDYLTQACVGDEALRNEVASLLAAHEQAGEFIETPAVEVAAKALAGAEKASAIGRQIAHYQVVSLLGAGGMGEVYLAEDMRLGRQAALKLLPASLAGLTGDAERAHRFKREARAASALNHPNVATIYEIGEAEEISYIAMEYVAGQTLARKINGRPLETSETINIAAQIADALDEAHGKGITHRDIKPANIMLTPRGVVKVLDFGLAKIGGAPAATADLYSTQTATRPGMVMGTVMYMSPEQALAQEVDHRSDIFSLGVVIYEMATGRLPFSGASASETIDRIIHAQPEAVARFNYEVPPELERIIRKCLEKDRERRYQSARELLVDLKNLKRDSDSGAVVPVSQLNAPKNNARRNAAIAIAFAIIAAVAVFLFSRDRRENNAQATGAPLKSLIVLPLANADPASDYLSDGITESVINRLSQLPQLKVIARTTAFRYKGKEADPQTVGRELKVDAVITGRVARQSGMLIVQADLVNVADGAQIWGGRFNRKLADILAVQEEIAQQISENLRLRLSGAEQKLLATRHTTSPDAYELYLKGRFFWGKWTNDSLKKAGSSFEQALKLDPNYAPAHSGLADTYNLLGYLGFMPPREAFPKSEAAARQALKLDDALGEAYLSLAKTKFFYDWDWPGFEREIKRALELNPNYPDVHSMNGTYLSAMGKHDESFAARKHALELDPLSPLFATGIGWTFFYQRRYEQAIEWYKRALEVEPNFIPAQNSLGDAAYQRGDYDQAVAAWLKAKTISGASAETISALRQAYAAAGIKGYWRQELELTRSQQGKIGSWQMASIHAELGERDQAFVWLNKAYEERASLLPFLKVTPIFDSLRADPRYADLLRRVGHDSLMTQ